MTTLAILMFITLCLALLSGFPVAFVLAGVSLIFAAIGVVVGEFDPDILQAIPARIYGIMNNDLLIAVPLFVFMGAVLERAKIAEELLTSMAGLFGGLRGGLGLSVLLVGALLAASTGIVGATVVTMGMIALPSMLRAGYAPSLSCGSICAAGTLGQIIPPSIVLILLGDQISSAWQTMQLERGAMTPEPVTVADLFMGALLPGLGLVALYMVWLIVVALWKPEKVPPMPAEERAQKQQLRHILAVLFPPLLLIVLVLGSILGGIATTTESAAVGGIGAVLLALGRQRLSLKDIKSASLATAEISAMIFTILIGAAIFTIVFRGLGGDVMVHDLLADIPGGLFLSLLLVMVVMFILGFFLDFIEIIFVVVPLVTPALLAMGAHPIWLAVLFAINLQTSFLTPPFGFSLFYLRGVAPDSVATTAIYRGVLPFVGIQLFALLGLALFPELATFLPEWLYDKQLHLPDEQPVLPLETEPASDADIDF